MLPLGLGWSLWIHLFVQFPKTIGTLILASVLSSLPMKHTGLGTGDWSVGRTVFCAVMAEGTATVCEPGIDQGE